MGTQPEQPDDEAAFPLCNRLKAFPSNAGRADMLLRLSDAALLAYPMELSLACAKVGFVAGQCFVAARSAALCMQRDAHGLLPETYAGEIEALRQELSHVAAGL